MVRGCIFDYDGVILYTARYHYCAYSVVAAYMSSTYSFDEYLSMNGVKREYVIDYIAKASTKAIDDATKKYCYDLKQKVYSLFVEDLSKKDLIPGIEEFLQVLKEAGIRMAVASGGKSAKTQLEKLGLSKYFDVIIDGNSAFPSKPAPDIFDNARTALGLGEDETIVFEDAIDGITAAHAAGMKAIGIGAHLEKMADYVIADFENQGIELLKKMDMPK